MNDFSTLLKINNPTINRIKVVNNDWNNINKSIFPVPNNAFLNISIIGVIGLLIIIALYFSGTIDKG